MDELKEKINQLFILGYKGSDFQENHELVGLLEKGLGGIIFFTQNIIEEFQFKNQVKLIKQIAKIPPFLSIDEEGGRVERFENLNKDCPSSKKYLSAKYIAQKGETAIVEQTKKICEDLKAFGINMNFAPVLDVNSNPNNPIIGERAYSNNPKEVSKYALITNRIYNNNGIITVGKHFPGHGDTKKDSHKELPIVNLPFDEFEKIHISPFKKAIQENIPSLMVAHVHYECFDGTQNLVPASMSKNVLNYLTKKLNYKGLIISDDMEMGGIQNVSPIEAVTTMLKNGVNCFIFRTCNESLINLLNNLYLKAKQDDILYNAIEKSFTKIIDLKNKWL